MVLRFFFVGHEVAIFDDLRNILGQLWMIEVLFFVKKHIVTIP
jgi:hypothetical protein